MSDFRTLKLAIDERGVARVTLARPDKHNAIDAVMIGELSAVAARLAGDAQVRAVVIAAEGPSFCAGADLSWMRDMAAKDRDGRIAESTRLARMLSSVDGLPKPVIGRVHGPAYGGGVGMMCVCDVVIAAEGASFALTEARLGLIPATIGPYVVQRLGEGAARRIALTGRPFSADEARSLGLVSEVAAPEGLDDAVEAELSWCLKCAPGALADAKALFASLARAEHDDPLAWTAVRLAERWETEEAREGIAAFLARRSPPWARGGQG